MTNNFILKNILSFLCPFSCFVFSFLFFNYSHPLKNQEFKKKKKEPGVLFYSLQSKLYTYITYICTYTKTYKYIFIGLRFTVMWYYVMRNISVFVPSTVFLKPLEFPELLKCPLLFITTPLITSEFMIRWSPQIALEWAGNQNDQLDFLPLTNCWPLVKEGQGQKSGSVTTLKPRSEVLD